MNVRSSASIGIGVLTVALAGSIGPAWAASKQLTCDQIDGATLAQNERWRILELSAPADHGRPLVACRRTVTTPLRVRTLGDVRAETYGGPDIVVDALAGDRLILRRGGYDTQAGGWSVQLVDLGTGGTAPIGTTKFEVDWASTTLISALAPGGGLASAAWTESANGQPVASTGPLMLWGPTGPAAQPQSVSALAPSHGAEPNSVGVYYSAADGAAGRVAVPAPTAGEFTTPDPAMALHGSARLRAQRPAPAGTAVIPLPLTADSRRAYADGGLRVTVRRARRPADQTTVLRYGRVRLAKLAAGSAASVHVVETTAYGVLVVARFADRSRHARLRYLPFAGDAGTLDISAPPSIETLGDAALDARFGSIAISDGEQVTVFADYGRGAPVSYPIAGAHDLAFDGIAGGLFVTDGAGSVIHLTRRS